MFILSVSKPVFPIVLTSPDCCVMVVQVDGLHQRLRRRDLDGVLCAPLCQLPLCARSCRQAALLHHPAHEGSQRVSACLLLHACASPPLL